MVQITEESAVSRFEQAHTASQEAVETLSMWILHHKESIDRIVSGWLKVFKRGSSDNHRITLFYIMNDAVQKAKAKNWDYFTTAFQPAVLSAITIARTLPKVKKAMERCITLFMEREIFSHASVTAMNNILHGAETGDTDDGCLELNSAEVCTSIENFNEGCKITSELKDLVENTNFETIDELKGRIQDKRSAEEELKINQEVLDTLIETRHTLEAQKKKMLELIETLEIAKRLYAHSLKEVTVVEDAYLKFYQGIKDTQRELLEMRRTGVYPAATPPRDCPSPTENEDLFDLPPTNSGSSTMRDNHVATDMDMDDDDHESAAPPHAPFNRSLSGWPPPGLLPTNPPPPGLVVPPGFNLPPPQLLSPGSLSATRPPGFLPNLPPPSMIPLPNMSQPPPVVSPTSAPRDPRQAPQSFNGQSHNPPPNLALPGVNPQAFSQPSSSQDSMDTTPYRPSHQNQRFIPYNDNNHQGGYRDRQDSFDYGRQGSQQRDGGFKRRESSDGGGYGRRESAEGGAGYGRRESWDRDPRDPRDPRRGNHGGFRENRDNRRGNGYRGNDKWNDRRN